MKCILKQKELQAINAAFALAAKADGLRQEASLDQARDPAKAKWRGAHADTLTKTANTKIKNIILKIIDRGLTNEEEPDDDR